jgi:hypothetical protein
MFDADCPIGQANHALLQTSRQVRELNAMTEAAGDWGYKRVVIALRELPMGEM